MNQHTLDRENGSGDSAVVTFAIVALCSLLFCSKGVFVKRAYAVGASPILLLALRVGLSFPFFAVAACLSANRSRSRLTPQHHLKMAGLAFVGYYLSSLMNFAGLQYVSVGLERIILFTYPTLVVMGGALFLKRPIDRRTGWATALAYLGVCVGFGAELTRRTGWKDTSYGVLLILLSAVTYAIFLLLGGDLVKEVGSMRFTAHVVGMSCLFMLIHYASTQPLHLLVEQPRAVYENAVFLAIGGTVIPSFLMGLGLRRAGPAKFAVICAVGPIGTVILAAVVLGEPVGPIQVAGLGLSLAGGLMVSLLRVKPDGG